MIDILHQATDSLIEHEGQFMTWGPPVILLVAAFLLSYVAIKNWWKELFLYRRVRKLGIATLRNMVIPDGMDGRVLVENIILTPDGIYVLPVKRYCGIIFAADNDPAVRKKIYEVQKIDPDNDGLESIPLVPAADAIGIPVSDLL